MFKKIVFVDLTHTIEFNMKYMNNSTVYRFVKKKLRYFYISSNS